MAHEIGHLLLGKAYHGPVWSDARRMAGLRLYAHWRRMALFDERSREDASRHRFASFLTLPKDPTVATMLMKIATFVSASDNASDNLVASIAIPDHEGELFVHSPHRTHSGCFCETPITRMSVDRQVTGA